METSILGRFSIPGWMTKFIVGIMMVEYGPSKSQSRIVPCLILQKELEPELPGFVGYLQKEMLLFISEEVPKRFRLPILHHELAEAYDLMQEGRCLRAFESELFYAKNMGNKYFRYRRRFFERLVAFYSRPGQHPDPESLGEIIATRDYLQETYPDELKNL